MLKELDVADSSFAFVVCWGKNREQPTNQIRETASIKVHQPVLEQKVENSEIHLILKQIGIERVNSDCMKI